MAKRAPSVGILLGLEPRKKGEPGEEEELDEGGEDSEVDPAVAAQLSKAGISDPVKQAAMVEAFRLCFEQLEREPHGEYGEDEG